MIKSVAIYKNFIVELKKHINETIYVWTSNIINKHTQHKNTRDHKIGNILVLPTQTFTIAIVKYEDFIKFSRNRFRCRVTPACIGYRVLPWADDNSISTSKLEPFDVGQVSFNQWIGTERSCAFVFFFVDTLFLASIAGRVFVDNVVLDAFEWDKIESSKTDSAKV